MDDVHIKIKPGGGAGPFQVQVGMTTRVLVEFPVFQTVILDELDAPVPGVLVRVTFSDGHALEQTTDAEGKVSIEHDRFDEVVDVTLPNLDGSLWDVEQG